MNKFRKQTGLTLLEITIVLVIISIVVGVVLKGTSLIQNSRTKSLITMKGDVQTAFNAFVDRYRALPGDYSMASGGFTCGATPCFNGNGNGRIESAESVAVWQHLSGFMTTAVPYDSDPPNAQNSMANPFGGVMKVEYVNGHILNFGNMIPVEVLAEVDTKIDNNLPLTGKFKFSKYSSDGNDPSLTACVLNDTWNIKGGEVNCGASWKIQ